jgi:hypothetical protein
MSKVARSVILATQAGALRTSQFEGRDHFVVPVVMILEGVVWAGNSPRPELVLASELAKFPMGWNGRPVVGGHPSRHGNAISANDPLTLGMEKFGTIFNAEMKGLKLCAEAWIDPDRANKPGSIGERALERIKEGKEVLEVSVGAYIVSEDAIGTYQGKPYEGIWREIMPDHLAILAEGDIGACSVDMGCGAMRAATIHIVTNDGIQMKGEPMANEKKGILAKAKEMWDALRLQTLADVTDGDIRRSIDKVLVSTEPAYLGIEDVSQQGGWVVFAATPNGAWQWFQRSFTVDDAGNVDVKDDKTEVKPSTPEWEPVAAQAPTEPTTACGCGKDKPQPVAAPTAAGETVMTKEERIAALLGSKKLGPAMTQKVLNTLSEEQLKEVEQSVTDTPDPTPVPEPKPEPKPAETPKPTETPTGAAAKPQSMEEYIASAPSELQDSLREGARMARAKREGLIASLKALGSDRCKFSDAELAVMSTPTLESMAAMAGVQQPTTNVVDFSLSRGAQRVAGEKKGVPPAPDLVGAIQSAAKK